jgi:hypothetical protein
MNNFNFAGSKEKKNYFEGWFIKIIDNKNNCYSFIFGVTLNQQDPHSFIQIIDQNQDKSYYYRFKIGDFYYSNNVIIIGSNSLSTNRLRILIDSFDIDIIIKPTVLLKNRIFGNSVMGAFKYLNLPTQHEIIFMNSEIRGTIKTENRDSKIYGNAYMEKDLGTRFPKKWFWIQSNNFLNNDIALVVSKADLISNFTGFFCFLNVNGKEYRFATYNCSKIKHYRNEDNITVILQNNEYILVIKLKWNPGNMIVAPIKNARMKRKIEESSTSTLTLSLFKNKEMILFDTSYNVSCEYLY